MMDRRAGWLCALRLVLAGLLIGLGACPAGEWESAATAGPRHLVEGDVQALVASGDTLYVGGGFTSIGGVSRNHLAAIDASRCQRPRGWREAVVPPSGGWARRSRATAGPSTSAPICSQKIPLRIASDSFVVVRVSSKQTIQQFYGRYGGVAICVDPRDVSPRLSNVPC